MGGDAMGGGGSSGGVTADDLWSAGTRAQTDQEDADLDKELKERQKARMAAAAAAAAGQPYSPYGTPGGGGGMGFDTTSEAGSGPMAPKDRKWW